MGAVVIPRSAPEVRQPPLPQVLREVGIRARRMPQPEQTGYGSRLVDDDWRVRVVVALVVPGVAFLP
jgi:hypothetical protein